LCAPNVLQLMHVRHLLVCVCAKNLTLHKLNTCALEHNASTMFIHS